MNNLDRNILRQQNPILTNIFTENTTIKKGLMEDLLSGKKQVKVQEELISQKEN